MVAATLWRTLLACALAATLCAQATPDQQNSVFEGTVRDSVAKLPIGKAAVGLTPVSPQQPAFVSLLSDAAGRFRIENVPPGDYRIRIQPPGHNRAETAAIVDGRSTATVHLTAGATVTAVIEIDPEAEVAGVVTDADGDPVAAVVYAISEQWQRGIRIYRQVGSAETDDRGRFRIKVVAGRYYFSALPEFNVVVPRVFAEDPGKPEMRDAEVVYPNASTVEGGSPLDLRPAQQLSGINFKLRSVPTYHVRGSIKLYGPVPPQVYVNLWRRNGDRSPGTFGARIAKDGTFDIMGVPAGSYWLELMPLRGSVTGGMQLDVTDKDLNGIKLPSIPPFDINCKVRFEQDGVQPPLSSAKLRVDWLNWFQFPFTLVTLPADDGKFVFPLRPAGVHVITLAPEHDIYIRSISYNGHEVEGGRIDFTNGAVGEVDIVLATGTGQVNGTVHWPDSAPGAPPPPLPPNAVAVLVSAAGVTGNSGARSVSIDPAGHFQFPFVPPGRYFAFISQRFDEGLWQNADFVQQIAEWGASVDVPEKGSATVEVPLLSGADLDRAVAKVPR